MWARQTELLARQTELLARQTELLALIDWPARCVAQGGGDASVCSKAGGVQGGSLAKAMPGRARWNRRG